MDQVAGLQLAAELELELEGREADPRLAQIFGRHAHRGERMAAGGREAVDVELEADMAQHVDLPGPGQIGREACRDRVCQYRYILGDAVLLKKKQIYNDT